jgi:hypothetical protein
VSTRVVNIRDLPKNLRDWPDDHVYIGRSNLARRLPKSPWSNPFVVWEGRTREQAVAEFEEWLKERPVKMADLPELKDKTLVCWCAPLACHGDVLARLADEATTTGPAGAPAEGGS